HRRRDHGHAVVAAHGHVDVARLEPALDETGCALDSLDVGGVVGDQALCKSVFLHREVRITVVFRGTVAFGPPYESPARGDRGNRWHPAQWPWGCRASHDRGDAPARQGAR